MSLVHTSRACLALSFAALAACSEDAPGGGTPALPDLGLRPDATAACTTDLSCGDAKVCVGGVCRPGQCNEDRLCPAGQTCDLATFICSGSNPGETPCMSDAECGNRGFCIDNVCRAVDCRVDMDCDPGERCTAQNRCVAMIAECVDGDGDGYGQGCDLGPDCDDARANVNPGVIESGDALCDDGVDNDCRGGDAVCGEVDRDGDGVTDKAGDCDDNNPAVNPNAAEQPYNGVDDDCDEGTRDADVDGDGYDAVEAGGPDCNDRASYINPEARDVAGNDIDEDCDGMDRVASGEDGDGDGFTEAAGDCNDQNEAVFPGAPEVPYNGIDDDCAAGTRDNDLDADGFQSPQDCDDSNAAVNPNAMEVGYNGLDDDCNAATPDGDADGDGFPGGPGGTDCNDEAAAVNPNAMEVTYNGADDDCNPATRDDDLDNDGVTRATDCNDNDPTITPSVPENRMNCNDGIDNDCRGGDADCASLNDDADGDGVTGAADCAPNNPAVPGPNEIVNNGVDDDCNPATPDGCDDDAFDRASSNGASGTATGVEDGNTLGVQYANLVVCSADEDWYRIDLQAGDGLEVDVAFTHALGDIDVGLFKLNEDGTTSFVDGSVGVTDTETVYEPRAARATTYYARVYGFDDSRNVYSMTVNVFSQCTDDAVTRGGEQNDTIGDAASMPDAGETRQICDFDDDWYTFTVDARRNVRVDVLFTHANGDLDAELFRDDSPVAVTRSAGVGDGEIMEQMLERGTYSVRVYGFNGSKNAYRVFVTSGRTATLRETMPAADVAIPDFANGAAGVAEVDLLFDAPDGAIIRNLTIRDLDINHSWLRDLRVVAQWDGEDVAVLWNRDGDINGDDGGLDDDSLPLTGGDINFDMRRYPEFAGRAALGIFTLRVEDNAGRDVGSIADLDVEIEYLVP